MINVTTKTKTQELSELYHTDYYTWALTNAQLLKEGKLNEIDYINLAEEVKDLGISEYRRLESFFANLLSHIYKWDNQPELRSKSWKVTVVNSLLQIEDVIQKNPGLKSKINEAIYGSWREAVNILLKDIKDDDIIDSIPNKNPYSFKQTIKKAYEIAPDKINKTDISFLEDL
jgi:hypothetical protein